MLDAIGTKHAATQYNVFASLSNLPMAYMSYGLGVAATRWEPTGRLWTESVSGVLGVVLFGGVVIVMNLVGLDAGGRAGSNGVRDPFLRQA